MTLPRLTCLLVSLYVLAGCAHNHQLRTTVAKSDVDKCSYSPDAPVPPECKTYSMEDHGNYLLSVVEFDEQGWFRDRRQQDLLLDTLKGYGDQDVILAVYVHGWKHNADFCDSNICCFRSTLDLISRLETVYSTARNEPPRKIVGVYVGWRGLSLKGADAWENLSFYERKEAATHVALGSTRELLARLRQFQTNKNRKDSPFQSARRSTRMITLGHSFGGLIVYSAISQSMVNSTVEDAGDPSKDPVDGFGDLVVLVNPAFEASRYEPLYSVAHSRTQYPPGQTPVFVAVTSTNDDATRLAFPAGRTLGSMFESYSGSGAPTGDDYQFSRAEEKQADRRTIGHVDRYRTHTLMPDPDESKPAAVPKDNAACSCPYAENIAKIGTFKFQEEQTERNKFFCETLDADGRRAPGWVRNYNGVVLKQERGNPDSPFWIVQTKAPVVSDHNEFYTPLFMGFLRELYDDVLTGQAFDRKVCEQKRSTEQHGVGK